MHLLCCTYNHYSTKEGCQTTGMSNDWGAGRLGQPHRALRPVKRPPQHRGTRNAARPATHRGPLRLHRLRTAPGARRAPRAPCARDSHAPVRSGPRSSTMRRYKPPSRAHEVVAARPAPPRAPSFSTTTLSAPITVRIRWRASPAPSCLQAAGKEHAGLGVSFSTSSAGRGLVQKHHGRILQKWREQWRCAAARRPERRAPFSPMRVRYPCGQGADELVAVGRPRRRQTPLRRWRPARPRRMLLHHRLVEQHHVLEHLGIGRKQHLRVDAGNVHASQAHRPRVRRPRNAPPASRTWTCRLPTRPHQRRHLAPRAR